MKPEKRQTTSFILNEYFENSLPAWKKPLFPAVDHPAFDQDRDSHLGLIDEGDLCSVFVTDRGKEQEIKNCAKAFLGHECGPLGSNALKVGQRQGKFLDLS